MIPVWIVGCTRMSTIPRPTRLRSVHGIGTISWSCRGRRKLKVNVGIVTSKLPFHILLSAHNFPVYIITLL